MFPVPYSTDNLVKSSVMAFKELTLLILRANCTGASLSKEANKGDRSIGNTWPIDCRYWVKRPPVSELLIDIDRPPPYRPAVFLRIPGALVQMVGKVVRAGLPFPQIHRVKGRHRPNP